MKTPVVFNKHYTVYLENYQGFSFIHCDCDKWDKTIKQQLQEDVSKLVELHRNPIYAFHDIEDNKHFKFLKLMSFKYFSDILCGDGKTRQLFVRGL